MRDLFADLLAYTGVDTSRSEPAARGDLNGGSRWRTTALGSVRITIVKFPAC
jgi:hypothetical protein